MYIFFQCSQAKYCQIRKFSRGFYFRETSHMPSFVKIELSRYGKITLPLPIYRVVNFNAANMSFNAICEKKISLKFTNLQQISFYAPQRNVGRHIVIALSVRPSVPLRVRCISPIFFEVGIPNLMCGCILGWQSVAYHFRVTVTLTLTCDLPFIVITMSVRPASCPVHISYIL